MIWHLMATQVTKNVGDLSNLHLKSGVITLVRTRFDAEAKHGLVYNIGIMRMTVLNPLVSGEVLKRYSFEV